MFEELQGKRVLFITTKNLDYIRNSQELRLLGKVATRVDVIGSNKSGYAGRLIKVYSKLLFSSMKAYDAVFVGFAPQLVLPFFGFKLRRKYVVQDFFISMYDTLCCDRKIFKPNSFIGRILHWLDTKSLERSDLIICDTKVHGEYFASEFGAPKAKLQTLYLEADTNIYHPYGISKPAALKDKFVVLYFGSILPLQGVDVILETINLLKEHSNLHFIFIGPTKGTKPESENITYYDWLSQEELARTIDYADLCLAGHFNPNIEKAKRTIPGKAYIYQAMQKPMILGNNPANHELFEANEMIQFVEMGNTKALADIILSSASSHITAP